MEYYLTDGRAGMNVQAFVLMQAMAHETMDLPPSFFISTRPYSNCREMGFVIQLHRPKADPLNLAFFEHRNSDNLCALRWEGHTPINGGVTPNDIPEGVYPDKWAVAKSWPHLAIADAITWARDQINAAIAAEQMEA